MELKVYRIEFKDKGDSFTAVPTIPTTVGFNEDYTAERVCVASHIMGCIRSLELPCSIIRDNEDWRESHLYLYIATVPLETMRFMVQPTEKQVGDSFITGEMWLIKPTEFHKDGEYILTKQYDLPNLVYSRFQMAKIKPDGSFEMPIDRVIAPETYGTSDSFSFIAIDPRRCEEAYKYAEEYPYIP